MKRYSVRRDGRRFGVEALCLLMVLYGAPIQALQQAAPVAVPEASPTAGPWDGLAEGFETAVGAGVEAVETVVGQPWTDALAILLATGAGEELPPHLTDAVAGPGDPRFDAVPPLPPGFRESRDGARGAGVPGLAASPRALEASKDHLDAIPTLPGWNLLSIPEEPTDPDPAVVLAPIAGSFDRVFAYDACDSGDPWKLYDPADAAASDLLDLDPTKGFWVDASAPASLPSAGTLAPTTSWQLCTGWNLIGFPAGEPRHLLNALQSIAGKVVRVFGFDLADPTDPWEIWDASTPEWANDLEFLRPGFGYWVLVTEDVTLEIANQGAVPTVAITAPVDLGEITAPTEIRGTVESTILQSWNLSYRLVGESDWIELATGTYPVADAPLATFDPTLLLNGLYEIRLQALDLAGFLVEETISVVVEGVMKLGQFTLTFVDLVIPLSGLELEILRTYDSREKRSLDFGHGWTLDVRQGSYRNNRPPGDGWRIVASEPPTPFPCVGGVETKSHLTTLKVSEREIYQFRPKVVDTSPGVGRCDGRVVFEFVDGPFPATLEVLGNDLVYFLNNAVNDELIDFDTLAVFEPANVRLRTRDGRVFEFDLDAGVRRIEDPNGNRLDISAAGITHSDGLDIAFERDGAGRITRITDPLGGTLDYTYDGAGDLVAFSDRANAVSRYTYDSDHRLLEIEDPRGVQPVRNEFDSDGRLISTTDAFGKRTELGHDLDARNEVVTNRLGETRIFEYDGAGNIVREVDPEGGVTLRTFDARGNVLTTTDPEGGVVTSEYSAEGQLVRRVDPNGGVSEFGYDARGNLTTFEDRRGNTLVSTFDSGNNLLTTTSELGHTVTKTYDGKGNLLSQTDRLGQTETFEYDAKGNPIRHVDRLGNETLATFDAMGNRTQETRQRTLADGSVVQETWSWTYDTLDRVTSTTTPDGATTTVVPDLLGNPIQLTDPLGRVTSSTYDLMGRLVAIAHPDGTTESRDYDAEGRLIARTDRAGRTTTLDYDKNGRAVSTTYADGAVESQTWDRAGRLTSVTDGAGSTTTYVYDAAGHQVRVTDPLGNSTDFTYDANGNQRTITDALGRVTELVYDADDRLVRVDHPDGTSTSSSYDGESRQRSTTDAAGRTTEVAYDALGQILSVTNAAGETTTYGWDEVGNRTSQTDAMGKTTRFEYDAQGQLTARTLPDGAIERRTYRADGLPASHVDFAGGTTTFDYDLAGRPIQRTLPDGTVHQFTYSATGARRTATGPGGTTSWTYDARDRPLVKTDPSGRELRHTWDLAGRRTALEVRVGAASWTTAYTWDGVGRLSTVTDPQGGVTSHGYDAVGNRTGLTHPNGVTTSTIFDALDRLTELEVADAGGSTLHSDRYTLDVTGRRTQVEAADGGVRSYTYDAAFRLLSERSETAAGALVRLETSVYDAVGNRTSRTLDAGGGPVVEASTYDARDRLLSAGATTFGWDVRGRSTSRTEGAATTSYTWDTLDRLRSVTLADGTEVRTEYDVDGHRVAREVETPSGEVRRQEYLVDDVGPLAHVVAEIDAAGLVDTLYVRGDELLSLIRPVDGEQRFYHADGLGSIRALTDATGSTTDTYDYSAWGELLAHQGSDRQPYRFTGEPFDGDAGLAYHRARWLDPGVGRFLSIDPFAGRIQDPASLHKYLYAHADPVHQVDPTGLFSVASSLTAGGIMNIISSATGILSTAFRIYRAVDTVRDIIDYAVLIHRIIKALSAPTPAGAQAAFLGELSNVLTPDAISTLGASFSVMADAVGPHWKEMSRAIFSHAGIIGIQSAGAIKNDIPTWIRLEAEGRLKFVLFAPSGPGRRSPEIPIKVNRKTELSLAVSGGRMFGFGVRTSKKNVNQVFRIDWWEGELDLHYHIIHIAGRGKGITIWKP